jgi:Lon-like protease
MHHRNVTTIDPMVQDPPLSEDIHPRRRPRWLIATAILVMVAGIAYVVGQRYTSHLFAIAPGTAPAVHDFITVKPPGSIHDHKGRLLLVTVSLETVQPLSYIQDKLNHDIQLVNERALVGQSKPSQLNQANQVDMRDSTQTAVVVALHRLGYQIDVASLGAEVREVGAHTPADGHLQPGDVVTALDGTPTTTSAALVTEIRKRRVGDVGRLAVQSPTGAIRTETIRFGHSPPDQGAPHAFIGVTTSTKSKPQKLPFDVTINAGSIGGPSAGLAFTLGVIDELSQGDLTGGRTIAATGTIEPDGSVGPVGGVAQKTAAVRQAGAVAFLVPHDEYNEALKHAGPHLKILEVRTLEQALSALRGLGGDLSALGPAPAPTG